MEEVPIIEFDLPQNSIQRLKNFQESLKNTTQETCFLLSLSMWIFLSIGI